MPVAIDHPTDPDVQFTARDHYDVWEELNALDNPTKDDIWTDFTSLVNGKPKWVAMAGSNGADAMFIAAVPAIAFNLGAGVVRDARMAAVATAMRYNPFYLKNPSFAPSLNVLPYYVPAVLQSATISANGTTLTLVFSGPVWASVSWGSAVTLAGAQSATATYSSGNGTNTVVFSLSETIFQGNAVTLAIPGGTYLRVPGGDGNGAISGQAVVNGSTQTPAPPPQWGQVYSIDGTTTLTRDPAQDLPGSATWVSANGQITLSAAGPPGEQFAMADWDMSDSGTGFDYHVGNWSGSGCVNMPRVPPITAARQVCLVS